jgi:hypothetical protein
LRKGSSFEDESKIDEEVYSSIFSTLSFSFLSKIFEVTDKLFEHDEEDICLKLWSNMSNEYLENKEIILNFLLFQLSQSYT